MARKKLDTLTEPMFYLLLAVRMERHGYGIMQWIREITKERVTLGSGTLYALLERFEQDGLITLCRSEEKRKYYRLTETGDLVLQGEFRRLEQQVADMKAVLEQEGRL